MCALFRRKKAPRDAGTPSGDEIPDFGETSQTTYITGNQQFDTDRVRLLIDSLKEVTGEGRDDPDALLTLMVDRAVKTVGAERGLLFSEGADGSPKLIVAKGANQQDLPQSARTYSSKVVEGVLEGGESVCNKDGDDGAFDPSQSMINLDIRAYMCVPLRLMEQGRGALYVDARASERPFAKGDLRFFEAFADMLTIVWRNRQAVEERVQAERMARDLKLVHDIQTGLLPVSSLCASGYSLCGRVIPAEEAGGDYFDFFPAPDNRLAMAVGDVSGHGAGPALLMAGARAYLRSTCQSRSAPGAVLSQLNRHLSEDMGDDRFMSMFLGMLDPDSHCFRWANAGHPPPIVVGSSGDERRQCGLTGMALGVEDECEFGESEVIELNAGDSVVMFTDGVIELRKGGEQFGTERLLESVKRHAGVPADDMLAAILEDVMGWAGSEHPGQDDVTVAVLRRDS